MEFEVSGHEFSFWPERSIVFVDKVSTNKYLKVFIGRYFRKLTNPKEIP